MLIPIIGWILGTLSILFSVYVITHNPKYTFYPNKLIIDSYGKITKVDFSEIDEVVIKNNFMTKILKTADQVLVLKNGKNVNLVGLNEKQFVDNILNKIGK